MHGEENDQQEILTPSFHGEQCRHNGKIPITKLRVTNATII